MTDTNNCKVSTHGHEWYSAGTLNGVLRRICYGCHLKQKSVWVDYTSEEM